MVGVLWSCNMWSRDHKIDGLTAISCKQMAFTVKNMWSCLCYSLRILIDGVRADDLPALC